MKNDSLTILKQFTRKLANCKYRVPVKSLIDFFNDGKFGFTYKNKTEEVITNDYVFADDIQTAIKYIRNIFREPHISLKQDEVISLAETASRVDAHSLNETVKNEKLWKVRGNSIKPEYVHAYVNEENLAIYENRFICYLIDTLQSACAFKISSLCKNLTTLNAKIGNINQESANNFSFDDYDNFVSSSGEIPVLFTTNDSIVAVISSLIKSRNSLEILKGDKVYVACKKAGKFDGAHTKSTNIFENEPNYNYCYNFYMNYFDKDVNIAPDSQMYYNFVEVCLFTAINNLGFSPLEDNENLTVSNSAHLRFSKLSFAKSPFVISVIQKNDNLVLEVVNETDGNTAKYLLLINPNSTKISDEENQYYTNVFTVTSNDNVQENGVYKVIPNKSDALNVLTKLIKTLLVIVEGSEFIHTMYCPVCGSPLIAPDYKDFVCTNCDSVYHIYSYEFKDLIWIKRMPKVIEYNNSAVSDLSSLDDSMIIKEGTGVNFDDFVSKSFTEKLELCTGNQKDFYKEVKDYLLGFKKVRSKICFSYDNFFFGRKSIVKLTVRGKTLCMYIALTPSEFIDTKYSPKDVSDVKKYEDTPMLVKIKSVRGVKFAKELIDLLCLNLNIEKLPATLNFSDEVAISNDNLEGVDFKNFVSKSFTKKLEFSTGSQKDFYTQITDYILTFKKTRSKVSFSYHNFFVGRKSIAKIAIKGKTLCMYLALPPIEFTGTKYFPKDCGNVKKYKDTPMLIKIKSLRGVKFAKELIDDVFTRLNNEIKD